VGLEINGINFSAPNGGYLLGSYFGQNATLRHVTINGAGTGGLFHGTADKFTVIEWCRSPIIVGWYGIYSGPYTYNTIPNINPAGMQLNNNYFAGTIAQHVVRLHGMEGLNVDQCVFENPTKDKQTFRLHQGKDALIKNSFFRGSVYFGPLAGADGGIKLPPGVERTYIMSLRLTDVQMKGCLVRGNIHVDSGTSGLVIEDTLVKGPAASGTLWPSCIQIAGTYDTRPVPQFTLNRVDLLHTGSQGLTGNLSGKTILNSTFNGAPLT
jgi:hypothetical protein